MDNYPKTIFCDIDGVIFKHFSNIKDVHLYTELLPGVVEKFDKWNKMGHRIILTTGRPESMRSLTCKQIDNAGLFYHELIMSLPRGSRIVINDSKPDASPTAFSFSPKRDEGLGNVNI